MQRVRSEAVKDEMLKTLEDFRHYLDTEAHTPPSHRVILMGYLAGFEYEILKSQQEEDPRQMRLFD